MEPHCPVCGGGIPPTRTAPRKYCSDACNWKAQAARKKARAQSRKVAEREPCAACGGEISPNRRVAKFCSSKCSNSHAGKLRTLSAKTERPCTQCGSPIAIEERKDTEVCSYECRLTRENQRGKERYHRLLYGHTNFINDPLLNSKDKYARARALGYRSGLEVRIARDLEARGIAFGYETFTIGYTPPLKERRYTPDLLLPNGIIIELKGRLITDDRSKMKMVKEQHPDLDIRFVFSNARQRLSKASSTTYAMWAEKYGFPWAHQSIPEEWLLEPECPNRVSAILKAATETTPKTKP